MTGRGRLVGALAQEDGHLLNRRRGRRGECAGCHALGGRKNARLARVALEGEPSVEVVGARRRVRVGDDGHRNARCEAELALGAVADVGVERREGRAGERDDRQQHTDRPSRPLQPNCHGGLISDIETHVKNPRAHPIPVVIDPHTPPKHTLPGGRNHTPNNRRVEPSSCASSNWALLPCPGQGEDVAES